MKTAIFFAPIGLITALNLMTGLYFDAFYVRPKSGCPSSRRDDGKGTS